MMIFQDKLSPRADAIKIAASSHDEGWKMSLPQSTSLKNEKSLKIPTGSLLITTLGHVFFG